MKKITIAFVLAAAILLSVSPMASAMKTEAEAARYADVGGTWFEEAASAYGYPEIFSDGSGNFHPDAAITRMDFVRLLHRALGININYFAPVDIREYFTDVENSDVGACQLYDLVTAGIVEPDGCFKPEKPLSREDMIHFAMKALDSMTGGNYAIIMLMPAPFIDDSEINESYKAEIYKAVVLKLIYGYEDCSLRPKAATTRAEAVTVASRLTALIDSLISKVEVSASMLEENGGLKMTLTIENRSGKTVTINHTSGQKFDFKLFDEKGENLYTWSADKQFTLALETTKIKAGESVRYEAVLESGIYDTIKDRIASMKAYIAGTSDDFFIDTEGYAA